MTRFRNSNWWTRGWTRQELLAPRSVIFYDQDWIEIGTRSGLQRHIELVSGIDSKYLGGGSLSDANVAEKMPWAASRVTTREEDMAYCLLGIFGVNMPLIYGERANAFRRLQLEIIGRSDDETTFAWEWHDDQDHGRQPATPFTQPARHLACFLATLECLLHSQLTFRARKD